jgi:amidophosphoribosyltransferase
MCGIAGAYGVPNASYVVSLMLKALQHRGQEAAGIVSAQKGALHEHRGFGLVDEVFSKIDLAARLPGDTAVGHLRYATCGDSNDPKSIQPLVASLRRGDVAIAHNGNLTNYPAMRRELEERGAIFQSGSDTELFLHLLARAPGPERPLAERLASACLQAEGAFSLLVLAPDALIAVVDPLGFRPLSFARYGDGWLFASETNAFDKLKARPATPVQPGEMVVLRGGAPSATPTAYAAPRPVRRQCSFEHIYFTRPDSEIFGVRAGAVRRRLGELLAARAPVHAGIVISVPDSSNKIAAAYAAALGLPFEFGLVKNHYAGRTFITPEQPARELGVRMKLNVDRDVVEGKVVTVVDDSLVRGTTARKIVELLRDAGAREVHLRIGSPPVVHPCFWGIDTPRRTELIASDATPAAIAALLGADSLEYLPIYALREALGDPAGASYCTTCFTGTPPDDRPIPASSLVRRPA